MSRVEKRRRIMKKVLNRNPYLIEAFEREVERILKY